MDEDDATLDEYIIKSYQDAAIMHELEERVLELEACNDMLLAEAARRSTPVEDDSDYRVDPQHELVQPLEQYLRSYKLVKKCPVAERPANNPEIDPLSREDE